MFLVHICTAMEEIGNRAEKGNAFLAAYGISSTTSLPIFSDLGGVEGCLHIIDGTLEHLKADLIRSLHVWWRHCLLLRHFSASFVCCV